MTTAQKEKANRIKTLAAEIYNSTPSFEASILIAIELIRDEEARIMGDILGGYHQEEKDKVMKEFNGQESEFMKNWRERDGIQGRKDADDNTKKAFLL